VTRQHGGAAVVATDRSEAVVSVCRQLAGDTALTEKLSKEALRLHQTLFNLDRLQPIFVREIEKLVRSRMGA
jgi:hypothetical protein